MQKQRSKFVVSLIMSFILVSSINAKDNTTLETVTVTSQKQAENIQEVPINISVLDEFDIEDKKIESITDVADFIPNLMIFNHGVQGMNTPSIRGINANLESMKVSTGLFVDGVAILNPFGFMDEIVNIKRIEVLKGPQGTLYGKGSEAGAINIITKQPDNDTNGSISIQAAEDNKQQFLFNVNTAIEENKLYLGLSGKHYKKDGYIKNSINNENVDDREYNYAKAHLRWTPTDKLDISLINSYLKYNDGASSLNLSEAGASAFGLSAPKDREVSSNLQGEHNSKSNTSSLKIVYDINETFNFTSITTNALYQDIIKEDWDFSPATILHMDKNNKFHKISQEFHLNYEKDRIKWLVGAYYDKNKDDIDYEMISVIPPMAGVVSQNIEGNTLAMFSNLTYPINKKLDLITGIRYEKDQQKFKNNSTNIKIEKSWDSITPKIALQYNLNKDLMSYFSITKGYRSGGFNWMAMDSDYYSYDPEELLSYEIGLKSVLLENKLILNTSIYYINIDDMQVSHGVSPSVAYMTNAAKATSKGFEVDIKARISESFSVDAGFGYNDTKFDEFSDSLGDYKGNTNPYAPKYTFNLGGSYRASNGIYARADLLGYGKMCLDKANKYSRNAYKIVNTKIGYEFDDIDVYFYGKNIFNKVYDTEGIFGGSYVKYSDPREVGIQLTYRF